jgi:hypothetical protein
MLNFSALEYEESDEKSNVLMLESKPNHSDYLGIQKQLSICILYAK